MLEPLALAPAACSLPDPTPVLLVLAVPLTCCPQTWPPTQGVVGNKVRGFIGWSGVVLAMASEVLPIQVQGHKNVKLAVQNCFVAGFADVPHKSSVFLCSTCLRSSATVWARAVEEGSHCGHRRASFRWPSECLVFQG